ncbi:MAG: hypothetical protein AB4042_20505 [Leptolyngbyaceae cyanobacterium]
MWGHSDRPPQPPTAIALTPTTKRSLTERWQKQDASSGGGHA